MEERIDTFRDNFRHFLIKKVFGLVRTDFQLRISGTLLHWFFTTQNNIGRIIFIAIHLWTTVIAYIKADASAAFVTLILPFASEIFWLIYLLLNDIQKFYLYSFSILVSLCIAFLLYNKERHSVSPRL